ncbi:MAG: polysaccharide export protein [Gammaproteobacteria bacterium]|nr:polysaccharide export protein [Gammaproteobacteria bacterium]
MIFCSRDKPRFFSLIGLCLILLSSNAIARAGYFLQPGDILEISVWKEPDLQREVLVRPDGGISFPLVGNIRAKNNSIQGVNKELTSRLAKYIPDPVVTVSLKQMLGNRVYVVGKVLKPGEFLINRNIDVMQALSMAGGLNPFAAGDEIKILRRVKGAQKSISFRYDKVVDGTDLAQNIILKPGDVVVVP